MQIVRLSCSRWDIQILTLALVAPVRCHMKLELLVARERVAALLTDVRKLGDVLFGLMRYDLLDAEAAFLAAVAAEAGMRATVDDECLALAEAVAETKNNCLVND